MKREKLFSVLWSAVIAFCIAFGGISCLNSAFFLGANMFALLGFCLAFGAVTAPVYLWKRGKWFVPLFLTVAGILFWFFGGLGQSVKFLAYSVSKIYDQAYGWGALPLSPEGVAEDPALALGAVAAIIICTVTDAVMNKKPAIGAITVGLLPLFACMVVTDTTPSTGSLFWLAFGVLLLVLTQGVRRMAETDGNRLTAIMLIPALLATCVLFLAVPREGYAPPQSIPAWLNHIFAQFASGDGPISGLPEEKLDLSNVGPKMDIKYTVMEITAQQGGEFYLRGQSFDVYTGTSWETSKDVKGTDPYFPTKGLWNAGTVTIHLRIESDKLYLPYYTSQMWEMQSGFYENTQGKTYSVQQLSPSYWGTELGVPVVYDALVNQCFQLPETTRAWARGILGQIAFRPGQSTAEKAQTIANFVKGSAVYDKKTAKMPEDQTDFARWFLERGDTGYCVHFATAATVLLRAAGIPARYVTGYLTTVSDTKTAVFSDESHAWVEYLDYQRGWTVLDPTPAEPEILPTEPTVGPNTEPDTEETTAPTTAPPTQSTASTGPSQEDTLPNTTPTTGGEQEEKKDLTLLWNCLMALVYAMLALAAVLGQYVLRIRLRYKKRRGNPNRQALAMWKEIVHFSKLYGKPLSEELIALAGKAKFSQHILSPQELRQFKLQLRELSKTLSEKPWYQRLFWKLVFAAE